MARQRAGSIGTAVGRGYSNFLPRCTDNASRNEACNSLATLSLMPTEYCSVAEIVRGEHSPDRYSCNRLLLTWRTVTLVCYPCTRLCIGCEVQLSQGRHVYVYIASSYPMSFTREVRPRHDDQRLSNGEPTLKKRPHYYVPADHSVTPPENLDQNMQCF